MVAQFRITLEAVLMFLEVDPDLYNTHTKYSTSLVKNYDWDA